MNNTTVDRFQLLEHNNLVFPHKCAICGGFSDAEGRKFVDLGLEIDFFGRIYICTICFPSAAELVGYIPVEEFDKVRKFGFELTDVVKSLTNENRVLRDAVDSFRAINSLESTPLATVKSEATAEVKSTNPEPEPEQADRQSTAGKKGLTKPADEQRSTQLRSDESDPLADYGLTI
jgi:hypothetical protein